MTGVQTCALPILYKERVPLYEKYADIVIDCNCQDIRSVVEEIAAGIEFSEETYEKSIFKE